MSTVDLHKLYRPAMDVSIRGSRTGDAAKVPDLVREASGSARDPRPSSTPFQPNSGHPTTGD